MCGRVIVVLVCSSFAGETETRTFGRLVIKPWSEQSDPESEFCNVAVEEAGTDIWEWCNIRVPVIQDFWDADVLVLSVQMLLRKHMVGHDVGLLVFESTQVVNLYAWTAQFGAAHSIVEYDVIEFTAKYVTIGMFMWAVKCGFIDETALCRNLYKMHGALLFQAISLCHGSGLVDEDVKGFVRCDICAVSDCEIDSAIALWMFCKV